MTPIPYPQPRVPWLVRLLRLAILTFIGLSLLSLLMAAGVLAFQMAIQDRIVPGVQVADLDIGGLTRAEAVEALASHYQDVEQISYTFRDGDRSWSATAAELGLSFPADELVERAFAIGHGEDGRRSLREQADAWLSGAYLQLTLKFDEADARSFLLRLAREIDRERRDASLQLGRRDRQQEPRRDRSKARHRGDHGGALRGDSVARWRAGNPAIHP